MNYVKTLHKFEQNCIVTSSFEPGGVQRAGEQKIMVSKELFQEAPRLAIIRLGGRFINKM